MKKTRRPYIVVAGTPWFYVDSASDKVIEIKVDGVVYKHIAAKRNVWIEERFNDAHILVGKQITIRLRSPARKRRATP